HRVNVNAFFPARAVNGRAEALGLPTLLRNEIGQHRQLPQRIAINGPDMREVKTASESLHILEDVKVLFSAHRPVKKIASLFPQRLQRLGSRLPVGNELDALALIRGETLGQNPRRDPRVRAAEGEVISRSLVRLHRSSGFPRKACNTRESSCTTVASTM